MLGEYTNRLIFANKSVGVGVLPQSVWKLCASSLQDELPSQQFNTWIRPLQIDEMAGPNELRLLAPNRFICDWVTEKFLARIRELVTNYQQGANLQVAVGIMPKSQATSAPPVKTVF